MKNRLNYLKQDIFPMARIAQVFIVSATLFLASTQSYALTVFDFGPPMVVLDCEIDAIDFNKNINCLNAFTTDLVSATETTIRAESQAAIDSLNGEVTRLNTQISQMTQSLGTPLMQAIADNPINDLNNCLQRQNIDIPNLVAQAAADPVNFTRVHLTRLWQRNMSSASRIIGDPSNFGIVNGRPMTESEMINQAERIMGRIAARDPVGRCIWEASGPFRSRSTQVVEQIYPTIKSQYDAMIDRVVRPAVTKATVEYISPMLRWIVEDAPREIVWSQLPKYVHEVAVAEGQKYLMDSRQMERLSEAIEALAVKVQKNDIAGITQQQSIIDGLIDNMVKFDNKTATIIAINTIRPHGHAYIDTVIKDRINNTVGLAVDTFIRAIGNTATAIVTIPYEPWQAISEVVDLKVETLIKWAGNATKAALIAGVHQTWEQFVNAYALSVRQMCEPNECLLRAGPLGKLLNNAPTEVQLLEFIAPQLAQMKNDLFAYHLAVNKLSAAILAARNRTISPTQTTPYTKPSLTSPYTTDPLRR
jgi:hypothetical protein